MKKYVGQPQTMNQLNQVIVKDAIAKNGPVSRPQISELTKLSVPTVRKIIEMMLEEGSLEETVSENGGVGRRATCYQLKGDVGYLAALYIENAYENGFVKGVLVDLLGAVVYREERKIDYNLEAPRENSIFGLIDALIDKTPANGSLRGIAMGIPGVVEDNGTIYRMPNILQWEGVNLKQRMEERYGVPTYIENDVNLTAVGIYHKYYSGVRQDMVYMYFGEGIGAGIILRGKLFKGRNNYAGEISHMLVSSRHNGEIKPHRQLGFFSYENLRLIEEILHDQGLRQQLSRDSEDGAYLEDPRISAMVNTISYAIINMITLINPEVVALRGEFLTPGMLKAMTALITEYIGERNCPELYLVRDEDIGLEGTVKLGLSHSSASLTFMDNKGV